MRWLLVVALALCGLAALFEARQALVARASFEADGAHPLWSPEDVRKAVEKLAQEAAAKGISGRLDEPKQLKILTSTASAEETTDLEAEGRYVFGDFKAALAQLTYDKAKKSGLEVVASFNDVTAEVQSTIMRLNSLDVAAATHAARQSKADIAETQALPQVEAEFSLQRTESGDYQLNLWLKDATHPIVSASYPFAGTKSDQFRKGQEAALQERFEAFGLAGLLFGLLAAWLSAGILVEERKNRATLPGSPAKVEALLAQGEFRAARRTIKLYRPYAGNDAAILAALGAKDDQINLMCPGGNLEAAERAWADLQILKEAWGRQNGVLEVEQERCLEQACRSLRHPDLEKLRQENANRDRLSAQRRSWKDERRRLETLLEKGALAAVRDGLAGADRDTASPEMFEDLRALEKRVVERQIELERLAESAGKAADERRVADALALLAEAEQSFDALPESFGKVRKLKIASGCSRFLLTPETLGRPVLVLLKGQMLLGRAGEPDLDLGLQDGRVSRKHLKLTLAGSRLVAEDLGSTNGTFLRGERLKRPVYLEQGDILEVAGACSFTVHIRSNGGSKMLEAVWLEGRDGDTLLIPDSGRFSFGFRSSGLVLEKDGVWSLRRGPEVALVSGPAGEFVLTPGMVLKDRGLAYRVEMA
jgi:hypothetical protein